MAIANPGMLNPGQRPAFGPPTARMIGASAPASDNQADRPAIELKAEPIRILADVEARFEAI